LKRLVELARRRWFIVAAVFIVTTTLTVLATLSKPAMYESSGSFVVRPRAGKTEVQAFDTLIRGVEINATYATIARSGLVRSRAEERLGPGPWGNIRVSAEAVTGTNTLKIGATARDPVRAQQLAVAVSAETEKYVNSLGETFELEPLDPPDLPTTPVDTKKYLTISLGAMLGLAFGLALAAVVDALRSGARGPDEQPDPERALPPRRPDDGRALSDTATVTTTLHALRKDPGPESVLAEEALAHPQIRSDIIRAARAQQPFCVAVLRTKPANGNGGGNGYGAHLHVATERPSDATIERRLSFWRPGGRGALTWVGNGLYAVVLPGISAPAATRFLADWYSVVTDAERDSGAPDPGKVATIGAWEYGEGVAALDGASESRR
jgi:capsular polysaccharide biosynthesis protein